MNGDLDHWQEPYSNLYDSMGHDSHPLESGDIGYDTGYYTHLLPDPADQDGIHHTMPTDFFDAPSFNDVSYVNALYPPSAGMPTSQRQHNRQLYINTQLNSHQINDSGSSTASSISLSNTLMTPSLQIYSGMQPSIHISSPAERETMMLDLEAISPIQVSPLSHHSSKFRGEKMFDYPTSPLHAEPVICSLHDPRTTVNSGVKDIETQVPMPHILEWKRVIERCGTNDFVPQTVYQPYTEADRKRYIRDVELQETIFFQPDDSLESGISLDDALRQRLRHLKDKDDRMFVGCGPSVSIRLQWPGYPPWSKQIPTMDFKNPKGHITRAKLAKNIATCIRRFAEFAQDRPMEAESDRRWKIGKRHIKVEDLVLVSLHHVSKGSWQPQLRLRIPLPTFSYNQWDESLPVL